MRRILPWLPALLWAALLAGVAGARELPDLPDVRGFDKLGHFAGYFVLGTLMAVGWASSGRRPRRRWLLLLALLLGASDEVRQSRMDQRHGDVADWVADALGAAAGLFLASRLLARRRGNE
jgi:VanZ family protein